MTREEVLKEIQQAGETRAKKLNLGGSELTGLPEEIVRLTGLTELYLSRNQLAELPREIIQLTGLTELYLSGNLLTELPKDIGHLTGLARLDLDNNQLTELPKEIGQLTGLTTLYLYNNQLRELPEEIVRLTGLTVLYLSGNRLRKLPIGIVQLTGLTRLDLDDNKLTELPKEIGQLTSLTTLDLYVNQLTELPKEIGQLTGLTKLDLSYNQLTELPKEIGQLTRLETLSLRNNWLSKLPEEIGQLTGLTELNLTANRLTELPKEFGQLTGLTALDLDGNPDLVSPPPEVVEQGTQAVLEYLRGLEEAGSRQWVSKLLVVGQGGVGKTSMLRALRREEFQEQEDTTHGIDVRELELPHPSEQGAAMRLKTWDFAGQEIQHATHQFFLTNRALYLLVWNARHGYEQGRLYYWLETVKARAGENAPILLVATNADQRDPDLPLADIQRAFPQVLGQCVVSNKTGEGIDDLREAIRQSAAALPLMGELWPTAWLQAAESVRAMPDRCVTHDAFRARLAEQQVTDNDAGVLTQWMHELGDILHFRDNEELNDIVILKPQWVAQHIAKVLASNDVIAQRGIFSRREMHRIWLDLDPLMQERFLRLMEEFDLSYRTLEDQEKSLVVERVPLDEAPYQEQWETPREPRREIVMKYALSTLPAGIPTWFIARSHRFTMHTHWRLGALFGDAPDAPEHLALIQASPNDRTLRLAVRGPFPNNFFALLRDGLEVTLRRFPGLGITRTVPCPCEPGCSHEFDFEDLLSRADKKPEIECPKSLKDVSVMKMLFGIGSPRSDVVLACLDEMDTRADERHADEMQRIGELTALVQREFLKQFEREQRLVESHCPNVYLLSPHENAGWRDVLQGLSVAKADLHLCCQYPGQWHPAYKSDGKPDGLYTIDQPREWMIRTAPYLRALVGVLKHAAPFVAPGLGMALPDVADKFKHSLRLMENLVKELPEVTDDARLDPTSIGHKGTRERGQPYDLAEGAALRELRAVLYQQDPPGHWGGLRKILTPEGHYLWLCESHAAEFKK